MTSHEEDTFYTATHKDICEKCEYKQFRLWCNISKRRHVLNGDGCSPTAAWWDEWETCDLDMRLTWPELQRVIIFIGGARAGPRAAIYDDIIISHYFDMTENIKTCHYELWSAVCQGKARQQQILGSRGSQDNALWARHTFESRGRRLHVGNRAARKEGGGAVSETSDWRQANESVNVETLCGEAAGEEWNT